jgi:hypothetical protein
LLRRGIRARAHSGGRAESSMGAVPEADGRYLPVVLLPDGETVHNAFLDRGFKP